MFEKINDRALRASNPSLLRDHVMSAYNEIDRQQEQLNDQANQFQQLLNQKDFIINQLVQNNHGKDQNNLH